MKTTCHHPPRGINSHLPKKRGKEKKRYRERAKNNASISLRFSPWKKNIRGFYLLWDQALVLFPLSLFFSSIPVSRATKSHVQSCACSGPKPHLPRAPSGLRIAPDPGKVCERQSPGARSRRESAGPRAPGAERRPRAASHSLGLSHHGLCVLLCWRFHTQICFPVSDLQLYNKRFLFTKTVVIRPRANRMWNRRWLHAREILF